MSPRFLRVTRYGNGARGWEKNWTELAQDILENAGIGINSEAHRVDLPGHRGPHPELYHMRVYERLSKAARNKTGPARTRARFMKPLK